MKKTINATDLKKLVIKEVTNLKKFAKPKDLERLGYYNLDPNAENACVYGQLTGNCYSIQASRLIKKCCKQVMIAKNAPDGIGYMIDQSKEIFGNPNKHKGNRHNKHEKVTYYTPLEVFIFKKSNETNGNNKRIIEFLRGESKTLKLK